MPFFGGRCTHHASFSCSCMPIMSLHFVKGTTSAEIQAVAAAQSHSSGSTAYLNLETGDCHGDSASLSALVQAGVSRVVIGIRHPLAHRRGVAIQELRQHGIRVDVLGEAPCLESAEWEDSTLQRCFVANEVCSNCTGQIVIVTAYWLNT